MPTPIDQLPADRTWIARKFQGIERALRELQAAKTLQNSTIAGGEGLVVQGPDGASIRLVADGSTLTNWLDGSAAMAISSGSSAEIAPGIITATVTTDGLDTPYLILVCPDTDLGTAQITLQGGKTDGESPYMELVAGATIQMAYGDVTIIVDDDSASMAYDFTPTGLTVLGETWHSLPLSNGWTSYGSTFQPPQYRKMPDGTVMLAGQVAPGTKTSGTTFGTLPTGYIPVYDHNFRVSGGTSGATADVYVRNSGAVQIVNPSGTVAWLSLSGIRFPLV